MTKMLIWYQTMSSYPLIIAYMEYSRIQIKHSHIDSKITDQKGQGQLRVTVLSLCQYVVLSQAHTQIGQIDLLSGVKQCIQAVHSRVQTNTKHCLPFVIP